MFRDEVVLSVKHAGKFVSEKNPGEVKLPFGSEYSLYIKNKNPRKVLVEEILVDGKNVLDGRKLIVGGNSHIELEGFVDSSRNMVSNKFKFVRASGAGSGETGPENGTVTVVFRREKEKREVDIVENLKTNYFPIPFEPYFRKYRPWYPDLWYTTYTSCSDVVRDTFVGSAPKGAYYSSAASEKVTDASGKTKTSYSFADSRGRNYSLVDYSANADEGKTEKGSASDQTFTLGFVGDLEDQKRSITITIKGVEDRLEETISIPPPNALYEKDRPFCTNCGATFRPEDNYCGHCGKKLK